LLRTLLAVAALICVLPALAEARWTRLRTQHFELVGDVSERQLRQVGLRFEQFQETFGRLFPGMRQAPAPVVIVVFGSRRAYLPLMPLYNGQRVDVGGYFISRPDVNYITLNVEGGESFYPIIFHEYTHLLAGAALPELPVWFGEGLAEYYSTFEATSDGRQAQIGRIVEGHVYLLRERFMPLKELLAVKHDSPLYNEGDRRSIFYAESWALAHYLLVARPERLPQLVKYLDLYAAGIPTEAAFKQAFGIEVAVLEKELRAYVQRSIYQSTIYTLREPVEIDRTVKAAPMSDADGQAVLSDVLMHFGRLDEASARAENARQLEAGHVRATATLGRIRSGQGRADEARTLLDDAVARAAGDYLPAYYLARTLLRPDGGTSPEPAAARQAIPLLQRVVDSQKTFADAFALLGYAHSLADDYGKAVLALRKAYDVSPRHDYALMMAHAMLGNRDTKNARRLAATLAERGENPGIVEGARELLEHVTRAEKYQSEIAARNSVVAASPAAGDGAAPPPTTAPPPDTPRLIPVFREVQGGETREVGVLQEITCSANAVVLVVKTAERTIRVGAPRFDRVEFIVYGDDLRGNVSCGARAAPESVYVTWRAGGPPKTDGLAVAVEFLPQGFTP
jgi:tetratricopeptide (TPR) repeat protein